MTILRPGLERRWLAAAAVLAGLAVAAAVWRFWPAGQAAAVPIVQPASLQPASGQSGPLTGSLAVIVRPPEHAVEPLPVETNGALPVRAGGIMSLEVKLSEPAFAYLVWLDCEGRAVPLYPWNTDLLEITDAGEPPPLRKPATHIYSPLLGGGWTFGKQGGQQTILLLARRTPVPESLQLASLLDPLPAPETRARDELVILGIGASDDTVATLLAKNRGDDQAAQAADLPLKQMMLELRDHFELIQAVRFAHEGE